jgi:hypothetical protein
MDELDAYWKEYEEWEMKAGKHLADQLLPEYQLKNIEAKKVYKERKKQQASIDFSYIASPPLREASIVESQQLELWNKLIKIELKNLYDLKEQQLKSMLDMVFDRFLCCFLFHPEAWIMYSKYRLLYYGIVEARNTMKEAVLIIPKVPCLWLAFSELEEKNGDVDSAVDILRTNFEQNPSAFTFMLLQKLIRRKDGKIAARKLFSDTIILRNDGILGLEAYVAHAAMELQVNNEPNVALRVLNAAREQHSTAFSNVMYIKLLTKVLTRLGDFRQIRWIYEVTVGQLENKEIKLLSETNQKFKPEDELSLWEELLEAEVTMGMCDINRLLLLQDKIRSLKNQSLKDYTDKQNENKLDLFEPIQQLFFR